VSFSFTAAMYAVALFRFRLFDVVPVARETVLERMVDGMMVLDAAGRVADLNPAAQEVLGVGRSRALGRDGATLLEGFPGLAELVGCQSAAESDISVELGERWYQVSCSPLNDRRGFRLGRLIILHDVTQLKRAQERLAQQQRALAAVQERERVARELHDSVGQVLGYVSMQTEAARKLLGDGKSEVADAQLARLSDVARDAHADVREYILNLRASVSEERPFLPAIGSYLEGFSRNYGIQTGLEVAPGFDEGALGREARAQLLRIVQEALSNARRHGGARRVQVAFEALDGLARVGIQDDGSGFDPEALSRDGEGRFGLQFMRERAEGLGGRLEVRSAPGEGARVEVLLPVARVMSDE
jgi:PAS domain S-box-containing protein